MKFYGFFSKKKSGIYEQFFVSGHLTAHRNEDFPRGACYGQAPHTEQVNPSPPTPVLITIFLPAASAISL